MLVTKPEAPRDGKRGLLKVALCPPYECHWARTTGKIKNFKKSSVGWRFGSIGRVLAYARKALGSILSSTGSGRGGSRLYSAPLLSNGRQRWVDLYESRSSQMETTSQNKNKMKFKIISWSSRTEQAGLCETMYGLRGRASG